MLNDDNFTDNGMTQNGIKAPIISENEIKMIFLAKCEDFNLQPNEKLFLRFQKHQDKMNSNKIFTLENCALGPYSARVIAEIMFNHPHFRVLSLAGNNIGNDGAYEMANMILENTALISLNLSSNSIGNLGGGAIFEAMKKNTTIIDLSLGSINGISRNSFGMVAMEKLADLLANNKVLSSLDLSMTELSSETITPMIQGLSVNRSLHVLNLSNNNIRSKGVILLLENCVNTNIRELYLSYNQIKDDAAPYFDSFIQKNKSVKLLDLSGNLLTHRFTNAISQSLASSKYIEDLNLSKNQLGNRGIASLGNALATNTVLQRFNISACKIQTAGFSEFCSHFKSNVDLLCFECQRNPIRNDGAIQLAKVIANHPALKELNLELCEISDLGSKHLFEAIADSPSLEKVSIKNNLIREGKPIHDAITKNTKLLYLNIDYNDIEFKTFESIQKATSNNLKRWKDSKKNRVANEVQLLHEVHSELDEIRQQIIEEREMIRVLNKNYADAQQSLSDTQESSRNMALQLDQENNDMAKKVAQQIDEYRVQQETLRSEQQDKELDATNLSNRLAREEDTFRMLCKTLTQIESRINSSLIENDETLKDLDKKMEESKMMYRDMKMMLISAYSVVQESKPKDPSANNEEEDKSELPEKTSKKKGKKSKKSSKKKEKTQKASKKGSESSKNSKQASEVEEQKPKEEDNFPESNIPISSSIKEINSISSIPSTISKPISKYSSQSSVKIQDSIPIRTTLSSTKINQNNQIIDSAPSNSDVLSDNH